MKIYLRGLPARYNPVPQLFMNHQSLKRSISIIGFLMSKKWNVIPLDEQYQLAIKVQCTYVMSLKTVNRVWPSMAAIERAIKASMSSIMSPFMVVQWETVPGLYQPVALSILFWFDEIDSLCPINGTFYSSFRRVYCYLGYLSVLKYSCSVWINL